MSQVLEGGFTDAPVEAAHAFRAVLEAMARPGRIEAVTGAQAPGLSVAASVVALTLVDGTTPVFLAEDVDSPGLRQWLAFHTGAPVVARGAAMFAFGGWAALGPLGAYAPGTPEYPDRSATLVVEVARLDTLGARLTGPGIAHEAHLSLPEVDAFRVNRAQFPLGLDFIFCAGDRLAGLPRSTRVEG
ncbi:phosphonate C-P lyase system protein PhnH [Vannielia litorea]|uniref:Alpha-D-ribose 1-methylphosphonate 5-triphosphate synthase subunit PhnH n=1 Tax=Vannielia litorea TaxID=1217970 RepID=A0A1N6GKE9_9RHOB|nr:phosphonate C-P lyase system protein PhnH [Vannielia litorea]SIO07990.1 alpha-D-ribose 1-methylphosphonate 5-triphosphate synthase subunit PhnH [Vannielia litorea]